MALLEGFSPIAPNLYDAQGNSLNEGFDYDELPQAFLNGQVFFENGTKIPMLDTANNKVEVDADKFRDALNQNYKFYSPSTQYKDALKEEYTTGSKQVQAAALAALRGVTIGLSDPALEALGVDVEKMAALKEYNPSLSLTSEIAGGLLPVFFSGGGSLAAEAATVGGKTVAQKAAAMTPAMLATKAGSVVDEILTSSLAAKGVTGTASSFAGRAMAKAAPKMAALATEGAIYGAGNALSEATLGDKEINAEYLAGEMGMGALIGAGFGGALGFGEAIAPEIGKTVSKLRKSAEESGKTAVSALFGVRKDVLDKYIARKSIIEGAEESLDDLIINNQAQVQDIIDNFKSAKTDLKDATAQFKELKSDFVSSLKERKYSTDEALKLAKNQFKEAEQKLIRSIDDDMLKSGSFVAQDLQKLNDDIVKQSGVAMEELKLQGIDLEAAPVIKKINSLISENEKLATQESQLVAKNLSDYKERLLKNISGEKMAADDLKKQIQALDRVTVYSPSATTYDKVMNSAYKQIRYEMDDLLKSNVPLYKELMQGVSEDVRLLKSLDRYGDEFKASRSLRNIDDPVRIKYELSALKKLEERYGSKYSDTIEKYINQSEELKKLPEFRSVKGLESQVSLIKNQLLDRNVQKELAKLPEFKEMVSKQQILKQAELKQKGIEGVTGAQIPGIFKKAARGDKIALEKIKVIERELKSPMLTQMLEDAGVLAAFEKGAAAGGSRNVNLWGGLGAIVGTVFDSTMTGGAGGLALGALVDNNGPKMAKAIVDKFLTMRTVEKATTDFAKAQMQRLNNFFGVKTTGQLAGERILPIVIQNRDEKKKKEIKKVSKQTFSDAKKNYDKFKEIVSNKDAFMKQSMMETEELAKYLPEHAEALIAKASNAIDFLGEKLPKTDSIEYSLKIKTRPSDYELSKFNKYWEAVDSPIVVFDSLEKGMVIPEQVEVLKKVYPKMFEETLGYLVENQVQLQEELPYQKRLALSQFFNLALDPSMKPENVIAYQQNLSPESLQGMQEKMTSNETTFRPQQAKNINIKKSMGAAESISMRKV